MQYLPFVCFALIQFSVNEWRPPLSLSLLFFIFSGFAKILKTKGEENVAEKKRGKKGVVLVLVICVVWSKGMNIYLFFLK